MQFLQIVITNIFNLTFSTFKSGCVNSVLVIGAEICESISNSGHFFFKALCANVLGKWA